jgi:Mg/Co/Ni transporter MgtE
MKKAWEVWVRIALSMFFAAGVVVAIQVFGPLSLLAIGSGALCATGAFLAFSCVRRNPSLWESATDATAALLVPFIAALIGNLLPLVLRNPDLHTYTWQMLLALTYLSVMFVAGEWCRRSDNLPQERSP